MEKIDKIIVIAFVGKSGAGKDYCMKQVAKDNNWHIIVSSTTRPKRDYETEGVDYHFLTEKEFAAARFLETASFNGWHYKTEIPVKETNAPKITTISDAGTFLKNFAQTIIIITDKPPTKSARRLVLLPFCTPNCTPYSKGYQGCA